MDRVVLKTDPRVSAVRRRVTDPDSDPAFTKYFMLKTDGKINLSY